MSRIEVNEAERLRVAADVLRLARSRPGPLNAVVEAASSAYRAEIALVSVVGASDQQFVAARGLAVPGTHREVSFCDHAVRRGAVLHVPDATADVRFMFNPLVLSRPMIRSYLGAPIRCEDRWVGALCVISPRVHAFAALGEAELVRLSEEAGRVLRRDG